MSNLEIVQEVEKILYSYLFTDHNSQKNKIHDNTLLEEVQVLERETNVVSNKNVCKEKSANVNSIIEFCMLSERLCEVCINEKNSPFSMRHKERVLYLAQRAWNAVALREWNKDEELHKAYIRLWITLLYLLGNYVFASEKIRNSYLINHTNEAEKCILMCLKTAKDMSYNKIQTYVEVILTHAALIFDIVKVALSRQPMYNSLSSRSSYLTKHLAPDEDQLTKSNLSEEEQHSQWMCMENENFSLWHQRINERNCKNKASQLNVEIHFARMTVCWDLHWYEEAVQFASQLAELTKHMANNQEMLMHFIFTCAEKELINDVINCIETSQLSNEDCHKHAEVINNNTNAHENAVRRLLIISLNIQEGHQTLNLPVYITLEQTNKTNNNNNNYNDNNNNNNNNNNIVASDNIASVVNRTNKTRGMTQKQLLFHGVTLLQYAVSCLRSCKYKEAITISQQAEVELGSIEPMIVQLKAYASLCSIEQASCILTRLISCRQLSCNDLFALAQLVIESSKQSCTWQILQILWRELLPQCAQSNNLTYTANNNNFNISNIQHNDNKYSTEENEQENEECIVKNCAEKVGAMNETAYLIENTHVCKRAKHEDNSDRSTCEPLPIHEKSFQQQEEEFTYHNFTFRYVCLLLHFSTGEEHFIQELIRVLSSCEVNVQKARFYFMALWQVVQKPICDDGNSNESHKLSDTSELECLRTALRFADAASEHEVERLLLRITEVTFNIVFTIDKAKEQHINKSESVNRVEENLSHEHVQYELLCDCYNVFTSYSFTSISIHTEICLCELSLFVEGVNAAMERFRALLTSNSITKYSLNEVVAACGTLIHFFNNHSHQDLAACMAEELLNKESLYHSSLSVSEVFALMHLCALNYLAKMEIEENFEATSISATKCERDENDCSKSKPMIGAFCNLLITKVQFFIQEHSSELSDAANALWWCKLMWLSAELLYNEFARSANKNNLASSSSFSNTDVNINREKMETYTECTPFAALHLTYSACKVCEQWFNKTTNKYTEHEIALWQERMMWLLECEFELFVFGGVDPNFINDNDSNNNNNNNNKDLSNQETEVVEHVTLCDKTTVEQEQHTFAFTHEEFTLLPISELEHFVIVLRELCTESSTKEHAEKEMALQVALTKAEITLRLLRHEATVNIQSKMECGITSLSKLPNAKHCLPQVEELREYDISIHKLECLASAISVTSHFCTDVELTQLAIKAQLTAVEMACEELENYPIHLKVKREDNSIDCVNGNNDDDDDDDNNNNNKLTHILLMLFHASRMCINCSDELKVFELLQQQALPLLHSSCSLCKDNIKGNGSDLHSQYSFDEDDTLHQYETLLEYFAVEAWNNTVKLSSIHDQLHIMKWRSLTIACCICLPQGNITCLTIQNMLRQIHTEKESDFLVT